MNVDPPDQALQITSGTTAAGNGTVVIWPTMALLVDAPVGDAVVARSLALDGSATLDDLLMALTRDSVTETPSFAILSIEPTVLRVVNHGTALALPEVVADVPVCSADELRTWSEVVWPSIDRARLTLHGLRGSNRTTGTAPSLVPTRDSPMSVSQIGELVLELGPTVELVRPPAEVVPRHQTAQLDAGSAPVPDEGPLSDSGPDLDFGHLFEETTYRRLDVEGAAERPTNAPDTEALQQPQIPPADPPVDPIAIPTIMPNTSEVDLPQPSDRAPTAPGEHAPRDVPPPDDEAEPGLISAVPGMGPPTPPRSEPLPDPRRSPSRSSKDHDVVATPAVGSPSAAPESVPSDAAEGSGTASAAAAVTVTADHDLDDATVSIAAIRAARAGRAVATGPTGPTVQAVLCRSGHPNPTHADLCRTCDLPITDRGVHTVARPSLGNIRFDDGTVAQLDRHVVIGRNPVPDTLLGDEDAELLRLDDPEQILSRTHLVLRLDGWQVQAIDRDSLNHTYVQVPGRPSFQLRPSEPYPLPPGTIVRLGDEIAFTFEVGST